MKQQIGNLVVNALGYDQETSIENVRLKKEILKYFVDDCKFIMVTPYGPDALITIKLGKEEKLVVEKIGRNFNIPFNLTTSDWLNDLLKNVLHNVKENGIESPLPDARKALSKFTLHLDYKTNNKLPEDMSSIEVEEVVVSLDAIPIISTDLYDDAPRLECKTENVIKSSSVIAFFTENDISPKKILKSVTEEGIFWMVSDTDDNIWVKKSKEDFFLMITF